MKICDENICTGCGACSNICPKKCIQMKYNNQGFLMPEINEKECIKCGKCKSICISLKETQNANSIPEFAIGCWNKNSEVVKKSSSGGMFSILAEYVLQKKGKVVGCIMNEELEVFHFITDEPKKIAEMRGSKYVQSESRNIYNEVKEELRNGRYILFTGTPCQVAGLYSVLKDENLENLITVDLVCHGAGSKKYFEKYIYDMSNKYKGKIKNIYFRDKKYGWRRYTTRITFKNRKSKLISSLKDTYMSCYLQNGVYRENCYNCKFAQLPRIGDITLGDFCGIEDKKIPKLARKNGISLILINNEKAQKIFNEISNNIAFSKRPLEEAVNTNRNITKPSHKPWFREEILNSNKSTFMLQKKYYKYKFKVFVARLVGEDKIKYIKRIINIIGGKSEKRS